MSPKPVSRDFFSSCNFIQPHQRSQLFYSILSTCTCTCSNRDWLGFYAKIQIIVWDSAASEQLRLLGVLIDSAVYRISQTFFNQHAGNHWHKYFFLFSHNMFNCFAIRYYTIFVYNHGLPHPRKIMNSPSCCSQPKFLKNHCCRAGAGGAEIIFRTQSPNYLFKDINCVLKSDFWRRPG